MSIPNNAQLAVMRRLQNGLPSNATKDQPAVCRVVSHSWGREGTTVCFHRFIAGRLAPELYRVYADGSVSAH